jgi:hypothetical protein
MLQESVFDNKPFGFQQIQSASVFRLLDMSLDLKQPHGKNGFKYIDSENTRSDATLSG